ncbi:hypothetical protein [Mycobacterium sp. 29Ha]|uniref:hypothetical protein n=1 Tax=Mycobacterium sp. 29Ha TaxID=2939268 RepID=UPI002938D79A|nr:hypothetical protein [Mycobacterium sp. 29Ha]MDV3136672.1 hypothetical protein [Mycobacterium sp. 29Ha]
MDMGVYETLLTESLVQQLSLENSARAEYSNVDDAEQSLAIARHLSTVIERSLRAARTTEDRSELARRILDVLPETFAAGEALHVVEPGKVTRLDEVAALAALENSRLPRPAEVSPS